MQKKCDICTVCFIKPELCRIRWAETRNRIQFCKHYYFGKCLVDAEPCLKHRITECFTEKEEK